ncbi:hypothetical protein TWF703_011278 [Orbilia oligospora]|uniref:Uncharacterized protein n=1 Tax=Orbilia oligospora TaxID=2813651 RepID=A0A7C8JXC1_ORBOL|nr:hypothetical protein TWF703_011278 [Orbilia oligospora]
MHSKPLLLFALAATASALSLPLGKRDTDCPDAVGADISAGLDACSKYFSKARIQFTSTVAIETEAVASTPTVYVSTTTVQTWPNGPRSPIVTTTVTVSSTVAPTLDLTTAYTASAAKVPAEYLSSCVDTTDVWGLSSRFTDACHSLTGFVVPTTTATVSYTMTTVHPTPVTSTYTKIVGEGQVLTTITYTHTETQRITNNALPTQTVIWNSLKVKGNGNVQGHRFWGKRAAPVDSVTDNYSGLGLVAENDAETFNVVLDGPADVLGTLKIGKTEMVAELDDPLASHEIGFMRFGTTEAYGLIDGMYQAQRSTKIIKTPVKCGIRPVYDEEQTYLICGCKMNCVVGVDPLCYSNVGCVATAGNGLDAYSRRTMLYNGELNAIIMAASNNCGFLSCSQEYPLVHAGSDSA